MAEARNLRWSTVSSLIGVLALRLLHKVLGADVELIPSQVSTVSIC